MTDERMDITISTILRTGVIAAAALVLIGGITYLARNGGGRPSYEIFRGVPHDLTSLRTIASGAASFRSLFFIQFGLIVLMATPVARVIACALGFGLQRDWKYVVISLIVLALLLVSLI